MLFTILLLLFTTIVGIQFLYYIFFFGKFTFGKLPLKQTGVKQPVSVIVCAKNEAENIKNFFPLLISQKYSDYEIVLIDDSSSDETLELFEHYAKEHPNIKVVKVENNETFWANKKYALTLGIKAAKHDLLLFTDADCYPTSPHWIELMINNITPEKEIVLGYGAYEKKRTLLNKIIRFETLITAIQYFSWAKLGKPYMGVGRNLVYKKTTFFEAGGFVNHMKIRSGDDDLFINQTATNKNTAICFHPESFTYSKPRESFSSWFYQKRRHVSTAKYYKFFDRFQLALFYTSQLFFYLLATLLLSFQYEIKSVLILIVFRFAFCWISLGYGAAKLNEKDVIYFYPFIEIILIFTQLNVFITNLFSKPVHWK